MPLTLEEALQGEQSEGVQKVARVYDSFYRALNRRDESRRYNMTVAATLTLASLIADEHLGREALPVGTIPTAGWADEDG